MVARQTSSRRGVRVLGILVACVVGFAVMSASASAATVRFTGQLNAGSAENSPARFSLDGDEVAGFSTSVYPTECMSPVDQREYDDSFQLTLPASAAVRISGGQLHLHR
jgi:hypothetical protein